MDEAVNLSQRCLLLASFPTPCLRQLLVRFFESGPKERCFPAGAKRGSPLLERPHSLWPCSGAPTASPVKATHQPSAWSKGQTHMLAVSSHSGETSSLCSHWGSVSGVSRAFSVFCFFFSFSVSLCLPLLFFFSPCVKERKRVSFSLRV